MSKLRGLRLKEFGTKLSDWRRKCIGTVLDAGKVTNFRFLDGGPNGNFPVAIAGVEELRTGDYSAIQLGDDGFVYASSQQTQTIPDVDGSYNWGKPCQTASHWGVPVP